jgi:methylation protein EvaC
MKCKITNKEISPFMSFGKMPIANGFLEKENFNKEFFYEMEVGFSNDLSLFQLNDHPKPEKMFNENYPFFSGSSSYMKNHFKLYADSLKKIYSKSNLKIIEIGSNDGTMLKNFNNKQYDVMGFEPSKNVSDKAKSEGLNSLNYFFNQKNITYLKSNIGNTDIIYASNVICHVPDLNDLIQSIDSLLNKDGIFVFEEPYLGSMFQKVSYDQIYDEHIYMFSLTSVKKIFDLYEFELVDAEPQITHGGSMRYFIKRKNQSKPTKKLIELLDSEKKIGLDTLEMCLGFKKNCEISKKKIINKIIDYKNLNYKIGGYAATSKSTTVLNYCNIDYNLIDFICDTTVEKIGKFSPGTHIPIVDMNHFHKINPDATYLFAWNHKEEIFKKENDYKGKWFSHVDI